MKKFQSYFPILIIAVIAIAFLVLGNKVFDLLFGKTKEQEDAETEVENLGESPSYGDSVYHQLADEIDSILDSVWITETELIAWAQKFINYVDVLKVNIAYGQRVHFGIGFGGGGTYSLPQAMIARLSSDDVSVVNEVLNSKGINYQF